MTSNEAAERLPLRAEARLARIREELDRDVSDGSMTPARANWFYDEARLALAAERQAGRDEVATAIRDIERNTRRATVERIRAAFREVDMNRTQSAIIRAILDEEAAR